MITTYIGLGANLDDPCAQIMRAIDELAALPDSRLLASSGLYRSAPLPCPEQTGEATQPDYFNAVSRLETRLRPHALLDALQAIEQAHGRRRDARRWGPRPLDLDILLYGNQQLEDERLRLPHVGMAQRHFVLYPLRELAPGSLEIPGHGSLADLLERCSQDGLEKITS